MGVKLKPIPQHLNEEYDKRAILKQENERLKEVSDGLLKMQYKLASNCDKYRSALEEIRDTLNKIFNVCDENCGNASEIAKVVVKINEVLQ